MEKSLTKFWEDIAKINLYYSKYVLPYAVIIHLVALIGIDIYLVKQDILVSSSLRAIPVIYILLLIYLRTFHQSFLFKNNFLLFFMAGLFSAIPISYHATQDLLKNNMLYSGGMGILILKIIMTMFVFMPRKYVYLLFILVDSLYIVMNFIFCPNQYLPVIEKSLFFIILSNIVLLISYHLTKDLRKNNYFNKIELEELNNKISKEIDNKNKYFSILAHDFKTPVNLLQSVITLIKSDQLSEERTAYYLDKVDFQLSELNNLISTVLDWLKTTKSEIIIENEEINIKQIISNITSLNEKLMKEKNILIKSNYEFETIIYDKESFKIILNNLIRNAIKYSDLKETIYINTIISSNIKSVEIINKGIEIDEKQIENFNTAKNNYVKNGTIGEKGHGLGLQIIKTLTELNKTEVIVEKSGNITKFNLQIPN